MYTCMCSWHATTPLPCLMPLPPYPLIPLHRFFFVFPYPLVPHIPLSTRHALLAVSLFSFPTFLYIHICICIGSSHVMILLPCLVPLSPYPLFFLVPLSPYPLTPRELGMSFCISLLFFPQPSYIHVYIHIYIYICMRIRLPYRALCPYPLTPFFSYPLVPLSPYPLVTCA